MMASRTTKRPYSTEVIRLSPKPSLSTPRETGSKMKRLEHILHPESSTAVSISGNPRNENEAVNDDFELQNKNNGQLRVKKPKDRERSMTEIQIDKSIINDMNDLDFDDDKSSSKRTKLSRKIPRGKRRSFLEAKDSTENGNLAIRKTSPGVRSNNNNDGNGSGSVRPIVLSKEMRKMLSSKEDMTDQSSLTLMNPEQRKQKLLEQTINSFNMRHHKEQQEKSVFKRNLYMIRSDEVDPNEDKLDPDRPVHWNDFFDSPEAARERERITALNAGEYPDLNVLADMHKDRENNGSLITRPSLSDPTVEFEREPNPYVNVPNTESYIKKKWKNIFRRQKPYDHEGFRRNPYEGKLWAPDEDDRMVRDDDPALELASSSGIMEVNAVQDSSLADVNSTDLWSTDNFPSIPARSLLRWKVQFYIAGLRREFRRLIRLDGFRSAVPPKDEKAKLRKVSDMETTLFTLSESPRMDEEIVVVRSGCFGWHKTKQYQNKPLKNIPYAFKWDHKGRGGVGGLRFEGAGYNRYNPFAMGKIWDPNANDKRGAFVVETAVEPSRTSPNLVEKKDTSFIAKSGLHKALAETSLVSDKKQQLRNEKAMREKVLSQQVVTRAAEFKLMNAAAKAKKSRYIVDWGQIHLFFHERSRRKCIKELLDEVETKNRLRKRLIQKVDHAAYEIKKQRQEISRPTPSSPFSVKKPHFQLWANNRQGSLEDYLRSSGRTRQSSNANLSFTAAELAELKEMRDENYEKSGMSLDEIFSILKLDEMVPVRPQLPSSDSDEMNADEAEDYPDESDRDEEPINSITSDTGSPNQVVQSEMFQMPADARESLKSMKKISFKRSPPRTPPSPDMTPRKQVYNFLEPHDDFNL